MTRKVGGRPGAPGGAAVDHDGVWEAFNLCSFCEYRTKPEFAFLSLQYFSLKLIPLGVLRDEAEIAS